jgi:hypothetical protein
MEWLNAIGSVASVIGLIATFYTLYKVANLPAALKQQSRDKQLSELIDKIIRLSPAKRTIADSTAREAEALLRSIRLYYVTILPWRQRKLKSLLADLERELGGQKQIKVVQHLLGLIRDEITIR